VIRAGQPRAAADAGVPGHSTQIDIAAAVAFEPVKKLVDIPGVGDIGVAEEVVDSLLTAVA
jgi:hypothetical protein